MPLSAVRLNPSPSSESIHAAPAKKENVQTIHFFRPSMVPKSGLKSSSRWLPKPISRSEIRPKESAAAQSGCERYDYHMGRCQRLRLYPFRRRVSKYFLPHQRVPLQYQPSVPGQRTSVSTATARIEGNRQQTIKVVRLSDESTPV